MIKSQYDWGSILRRHILLLSCALVLLMLSSDGGVAAQYYEAKINNVTCPSGVRMRERVDVKVLVDYYFSPTVRGSIRVSLVEVETTRILSVRTEELSGQGQWPFDFTVTAPEVMKTWKLRATVEYRVYLMDYTLNDA